MEARNIEALFEAAAKVRTQAHAPYSGFKVGAALSTKDGRMFSGCNVENAAYPSGTCAEESAIAAMVADGAREIAQIVVIGDSAEPVTPCGACRQRIAEFSTPQTSIHAGNLAGTRHSFSMNELLPASFALRSGRAEK